ncbi:carboxymuconolactone decarboxylase family protein [Acinetobacter pittii]|uniref:carboxymuconolactone decarboxylase family protein n=1 Tax=Acinetobacter calcoaceticus/baumannii complex TaxID=909768 RepID=UPI001EFC4E2E|nr:MULTISPECIES: carboxymuconolactone decarboxylase family protein [Acinetobacter calcoaceticus/baumannii complex]MCG9494175.1 carboxymuconolactone decarboxylase family protein [Acinetobacter pittii]MCU4347738.1 carboxymuconolactone decarboxylase family protein [Acinetobacter lactucae]
MSAQRIFPAKVSPHIYQTIVKLDTQIYTETTLDKELIELIKIKISQLNGCAFCIDFHTKQGLKLGITPRKIFLLDAFHETSFFTDKEKAALSWAEAVTFITHIGAKDEYFNLLKNYFSDKEIVDLTYLVGLVNVWNRLAISMVYNLDE